MYKELIACDGLFHLSHLTEHWTRCYIDLYGCFVFLYHPKFCLEHGLALMNYFMCGSIFSQNLHVVKQTDTK